MPILPSETWHTPDMTDLFNRFSNLRERREKSEYKETERSGIISASSNYHVRYAEFVWVYHKPSLPYIVLRCIFEASSSTDLLMMVDVSLMKSI